MRELNSPNHSPSSTQLEFSIHVFKDILKQIHSKLSIICLASIPGWQDGSIAVQRFERPLS